jgi:hypothetical protein
MTVLREPRSRTGWATCPPFSERCLRLLAATNMKPLLSLTEDIGELWLADIGIPPTTFERAGVTFIDPFGLHLRVRLTRTATLKNRTSIGRESDA